MASILDPALGGLVSASLLCLFLLSSAGCDSSASTAIKVIPGGNSGAPGTMNVSSTIQKVESPLETADAKDWPQILGANRNGVIEGEQLMMWGEEGPKQVWSHKVGDGYSGPVVVDNHLLIFHRPGGRKGPDNVIEKLNADTGELVWAKSFPALYSAPGPDPDMGPKATPLVHNGKIYLYSTGGSLRCLNFSDGESIWEVDILDKYETNYGYFGCGSTPVIVDNKLLLNVGGRKHAIVAFDTETGAEVWTAFKDKASYSSPIILEVGNRKVAFFVTRLHAVVVDVKDGTVLCTHPFGKRGPTAKGAMPMLIGDGKVFVNAAYGGGSLLFDLTKEALDGGEATPVWKSDAFASQYSTPMYFEGHLYGTHGREDFNNGCFRCIDVETGKMKWQRQVFPIGHTLLIGNKALTLGSNGRLTVLACDPEEFSPISNVKIFDGGSRSVPAISSGRLYARSNAKGGKGTLVCLEVGIVTE